jgi:hypothetical protein
MFKLGVVLSGASLVAGQPTTVGSYCQALWDSCPNQHGFGSNATAHTELCVATVGGFNPGDLGDVDTNTLGCRQRYLTNSTLNATATKCQYAGPSGGGRCGSVLNAVCDGATSACANAPNPSYVDAASCKTGLAGFVAQWGHKQGAAAAAEDSLECRLYHAIVGLATNYSDAQGNNHCTHFNATGGPCNAAVTANANHYCETVTYHCKTPTTQQWPQATTSDGLNECLASVGVFPNTLNDARASAGTGNTLGCREYHAQAAASLDAAVHCEHAGPSGGKACGTYTEAWISLAGVAKCSNGSAIDVARATTDIKSATTLAKMIPIGDNNGTYNINQVWDNTQRCRLYHLTTASVTPSHCSHGSVSGGDICGKYVDNLCTFIEGACGFGNSTYQFADNAACKTALSAASVTPGSESDRANNTLQCRFYHASIAASFATGGRQESVAGAAQSMKDHCNHVLASTAAGGCNAGITKAPTPNPKNDATSVSVFVAAAVTAVSMFAF